MELLKMNLYEIFTIQEVDNIKEASTILSNQYKSIQLILISVEAFQQNNYEFMNLYSNNVFVCHIPVICIGPSYQDIADKNNMRHIVIAHEALEFFAEPFNVDDIIIYFKNVMALKHSNYSTAYNVMREESNTYTGGTYWNSKLIENMIMQSYISAACILETNADQISIVKTNDQFMEELTGESDIDEEYLNDNFIKKFDTENKKILWDTIHRAKKNKNESVKCEFFIHNEEDYTPIHLRMKIRMIDKIRERALYYCIIENDTEQYNAGFREATLMNQLQTIIQNITVGITIVNEEYNQINYIYTNEMFYTMFGYTEEQFQNELQGNIYTLIHPSDTARVQEAVRNSQTNMKAISIEFRAKKRDGSIIYIHLHNAIHFVRETGLLSMIMFYEDVTEKVLAEARIREINEKLTNYDVFFQLDITNERIIDYRSKYESNKGGKDSNDVDYKETILAKVYQKEKDKVWKIVTFENLRDEYQKGNAKFSFEYRRYMPNRNVRWFTATVILVEDKEEGTVNAFIYAYDVDTQTKNRSAKDKIIDIEVEDITIVNIKTGMARNVKKSNRVNINEEKIFSHAKAIEAFLESYVDDEEREQVREFLNLENMVERIDSQGAITMTFWVTLPDGNKIRKSERVNYLDSTHEELLMVGRDVTALFEKETEQQMVLKHAVELADYANNAKSAFLSRMSHDMRTPLNGILGMNSLAIAENKTPEIEEYLKNVNLSGEYLLQLINDTLDLSKIESGKMEFHMEVLSIDEFTKNINTIIKPLMDKKHIHFIMDFKSRIKYIKVDILRFNQVFYNLLSNAAKYTPEGGTVEFYSERIPDRNKFSGLRFHIKDNGVGMSEQFQRTLFEPFAQEYGEAHKEQRGSGLGLTIVKQIIDLVEGNIQVKSTLGKGTEFIVDLYAEIVDDKMQLQQVKKEVPVIKKGTRVLVVDDTEINTMLTEKMLIKNGCIVEKAENGAEAVEKFKNSEVGYYDIILTDIRMPVMDGFEESRAIRALKRKDAKTIPIIAATADAYNDIMVKITEAGMNERLIKPIEVNALCETIARYTKKEKK